MNPVDRANRIGPAIRARRAHSDRLIGDVEKAIRQLRKTGAAVTMRGVAQRAGVSRTFLYENDAARQLVQQAVARTLAPTSIESAAAEVDSGWRERALNAESALQTANTEIHRQRDRIGELMGQLRDLEQAWSLDGQQRLASENTTLRQRLRQLTEDNAGLTERLAAARSNNRFLDRRIADLETRLLDEAQLEQH